jgi:peroxiredoxin
MATAPVCDFGWAAPSFALKGVDGRVRRLEEVRGEKATLVAFICNHCPYVVAIIDRLARDARELEAHGVATVAICANDAEAYPDDSFENMKLFAERHALPFHYLHDDSQAVARVWGAVCTPDFFGFDRELGLQYRGRLDAGHRGQPPEGAPRELFEAMKAIAETGRGPREQTPSMGCSIKWRAA